jgi:hypothetical protein
MRQWTESVFDTHQGPAQPGAPRRPHRRVAYARTAQPLLALAAAIWHTWNDRTSDLRLLIAAPLMKGIPHLGSQGGEGDLPCSFGDEPLLQAGLRRLLVR